MRKLGPVTLLLAAVWLAPPAAAATDSATFDQDLGAADIPAYAFPTLLQFAESACRAVHKGGLADSRVDAQVISILPKDVRGNDIDLTPTQAAAVWASAKKNIC